MTAKKIIVTIAQDFIVHTITRSLARGLQQQGHELHVVTFKETDKEKFQAYNSNINVHVFKKHYRWIPKNTRGRVLAPVLDNFIIGACGREPDLVLSNLLPADRLLAHSRLNVYMVIHNTMSREVVDLDLDLSKLAKIYTKKPTIGVSKGVMTDFVNLFSKFDIKKSHYIYNPMDFDMIKILGDEALDMSDKYIVHVGKFTNQQRHDILIKAYHQSGVSEKLVLVGKGELESQVQDLVKALNLEEKVIFAGFQSNPYPYIKHARLMVLSSIYEGLPTVILESLILKTPVISTDCESGPDEMLPNKNLTPVNDIDALASQISDALSNINSYKYDLKEDFFLENITKNYLKLAK